MSQRPTVVQTEELEASAAAWLGERCNLVVYPMARLATLNGELSAARGLVVRTYTNVDDALLEHLPALRVVGRAGVGLENIDVDACRRRGIEVVHTPDANSSAVAEYVLALLFDAIRPRVYLDRAVDGASWCNLRKQMRASRQLCEMTVGVLGLGRVGSRVARAAASLGARVIYHDVAEIPAASRHGAEAVDLPTLLASADVLSIHIDARPSNTGFVNRALLSHLKGDAIVVNTSRGQVVDAADLAAFLRANPGAMALLDVHPQEPFGEGYPLLGLPNARLTPHIAAATEMANRNMSWVVRDIWRVLSGELPEFAAQASK